MPTDTESTTPNPVIRKATVNISGFGAGYEDACQRMLWKGVAYLAEVQPPVDIWDGAKQSANIIGVMSTEGAGLKALEAAVTQGEPDITGAMHQAVMNHLAYIHRNGVDGWLNEVSQQAPQRVIEWEGTLYPTEAAS